VAWRLEALLPEVAPALDAVSEHTAGPGTAVRAAGGVVARKDGDHLEVLLVHRPRYDDWTIPKGKVDAGEDVGECALREVREETGVACRLGRELEATSYTDRAGRRKVVRYWLMEAVSSSWPPEALATGEVDRVEWLEIGEARARLTYTRDRQVLDSAATAMSAGDGGFEQTAEGAG
jgi:8-oxo-dGTP pyrophosphatase MutT (NUDIX family)